MRLTLPLLAAAAALALAATPARATYGTFTYRVTATDFTSDPSGATAPIDPFSFTFTVSYDPAGGGAILPVQALTLPAGFVPTVPIVFASSDIVAGIVVAAAPLGGVRELYTFIAVTGLGVPINGNGAYLDYRVGTSGPLFSSSTVTSVLIPEPASLALLGAGLLGLGVARRRAG